MAIAVIMFPVVIRVGRCNNCINGIGESGNSVNGSGKKKMQVNLKAFIIKYN
jgi:hypothetical protein